MQIVIDSIAKKILPYVWILFIVFGLIDYFFITNEKTFNSITASVQAVLIIGLCLYYFFDQLKQPTPMVINTSINFWIIIAFLIYLSGTFFLYLMAENMIKDRAFYKQYAIINSSFNVIKNVLLSVAMLMKSGSSPKDQFPEANLDAAFPDINTLKNLN